MAEPESRVKVGHAAPDFRVPALELEGTASLADYRGQSPVMLVINRGVWCSFCRRHLAHLGKTRERLQRLGVETLAVVAGDVGRTRLYLRHRPVPVRVAIDPELVIHEAYGLVMPPQTEEQQRIVEAMHVRLQDIALNPTDLSELTAAVQAAGKDLQAGVERPLPIWDFITVQRRLYAYDMSEEDQQQWIQWTRTRSVSTGQFLVDQGGIVRWTRVQNATDRPSGFGNYPGDDEFLAAAQALG